MTRSRTLLSLCKCGKPATNDIIDGDVSAFRFEPHEYCLSCAYKVVLERRERQIIAGTFRASPDRTRASGSRHHE